MAALIMKKSDGTDDWYTIERAVHANKMELRPTSYGHSLWYSGRISDADVEGTAAEMRDLATAIETRGEESHKRCAVDATSDPVEFWSPRNSQEHGRVPLADAIALAEQIRRDLPERTSPSESEVQK